MPKAIRIHQQGGPEVLKWEDVQVGDPGPGEARVRHKACGLNFLDVYQRSGLYKIALPAGMGNEDGGEGFFDSALAGQETRDRGWASHQRRMGGARVGKPGLAI